MPQSFIDWGLIVKFCGISAVHFACTIMSSTAYVTFVFVFSIQSQVICVFLIHLHHDGQSPTCRCCNRQGHQAAGCRNTVCFNCNGLGHTSQEWVKPMYCCICKSRQHLARVCPFSWHRPQSGQASVPQPPDVDVNADLHMSDVSSSSADENPENPEVSQPSRLIVDPGSILAELAASESDQHRL